MLFPLRRRNHEEGILAYRASPRPRARVPGRARSSRAAKQLKMQSTWPASLTLQDNFRYFADRVDKLTGGQVKIEAMAAGQIVPAFEILDATHKKVIDGGHGVAYYWVGKNKAATLFSATPAGPFGMDHFDFLGWLNEGGGQALYDEFYRDILKLNVSACRSAAPARRRWAGSSGRSRTSPTSRA